MAPLNNCSTAPLLAKMTKEDEVSLKSVQDISCESSTEAVDSFDHNHNDVSVKPQELPTPQDDNQLNKPRRRSYQEINARTRKMIFSMFEKHLNTNLNVLVIGQRGSGKYELKYL